jgi:hypothetical protein
MTIEIHQPQLEALIRQRMASGLFQSVEDLLLQTLEASPAKRTEPAAERKSLAQLFADSPFRGMEMEFPRDPAALRSIDL